MSRKLGSRQATGVLDNTGTNPFGNGFWCVTFDPAILSVSTGEFEIYHIALNGPLGSYFRVYIDRTFYDNNQHGDVNSWDPNNAMELNGGETVYFYFNSSQAPAPTITLWLRQPPIL